MYNVQLLSRYSCIYIAQLADKIYPSIALTMAIIPFQNSLKDSGM